LLLIKKMVPVKIFLKIFNGPDPGSEVVVVTNVWTYKNFEFLSIPVRSARLGIPMYRKRAFRTDFHLPGSGQNHRVNTWIRTVTS
jgi:hypothetical protein